MKLISCHIYGFGSITDKFIDFNQNLHSIFAPNGYGKSTLFDFIRVMLYGIPTRRRNESSFSLRTHYKPFTGDKYGGVLTIETRDGMISIERTFHASTATQDTLKISDNKGKDITSQYTDIPSLGHYFLGLDEDAYERTVAFRDIKANEGVGSNQTISAKLNSIATSIDVGQYDRAIKALEEQRKGLNSQGTKNIGKIKVLENEIKNINAQISELTGKRLTLTEDCQRLEVIKKEFNQIEAELKKTQNLNSERERWDRYQAMVKHVSELSRELESIMEQYPQGIPSRETAQQIKQLDQELKKVEVELSTLVFSQHDASILALLKERYPNGPIPMEVLEDLGNTMTERTGTSQVLEQTQFQKTLRLEQLKRLFHHWQNPSMQTLERLMRQSMDLDCQTEAVELTRPLEAPATTLNLTGGSIPTEEEMRNVESLANQYKINESKLQALVSSQTQTQTQQKPNIWILCIGGVLFVIGIVLILGGMFNSGIVIALIGIFTAVISLISKGSSNTTNQNDQAITLKQSNVELELRLKTFFTRFQRYGTDFLAYYDELKTAINQYKLYLQQKEQQLQEIQNAKAQIGSARRDIADYISNVMGIDIKHVPIENGSSDNTAATTLELSATNNPKGISFDFEVDTWESANIASKENDILANRVLSRILRLLKEDYNDLVTLQSEYDDVQRKSRSFQARIEELTQKIQSIVTEYNIPQENITISVLSQESKELERLSIAFIKYNTRKDELTLRHNELKQKINSIFQELSLSQPEDLTEAAVKYEHDLERSELLRKKVEEEQNASEQYRQSNGLTEEPQLTLTPEQIQEKELRKNQLQNEKTRLSDQIAQSEREIMQLPALQDQLAHAKEQKQEAEKELDVINKTKEFIVQANKNLLDRYVRPIMDKYQAHIVKILPWLEAVTMDQNYKISFKKGSDVVHNSEHLSTGERTCLELALRLALIENMYKNPEDYPVLMMDDPFAELDSTNLKNALDILNTISQKMQIVYFSCSEERRLP